MAAPVRTAHALRAMVLRLHAVAVRKADPALTAALKVAKDPAKAVVQKAVLTPVVISAHRAATRPVEIAARAVTVTNCHATSIP